MHKYANDHEPMIILMYFLHGLEGFRNLIQKYAIEFNENFNDKIYDIHLKLSLL